VWRKLRALRESVEHCRQSGGEKETGRPDPEANVAQAENNNEMRPTTHITYCREAESVNGINVSAPILKGNPIAKITSGFNSSSQKFLTNISETASLQHPFFARIPACALRAPSRVVG